MDDLTIAVFSFPGHVNLLPYVLSSVKQHAPPHKEICLIWDDCMRDQPNVDFDLLQKQTGCSFRLVNHSQIYPWSEDIQKWGWIKQQLVKLRCDLYTNTRFTWIVDGDVYITGNPELFDKQHKPYLRYDTRSTHPGYLKFITKYLGFDNFYPWDFVGSTCLFEKSKCIEIDQYTQSHTGMTIIECVQDCIRDLNHDPWPFSEFETYGTYIYNTCPDEYVLTKRNWNYVPSEHFWNYPIQVMWDNFAGMENLSRDEKISRVIQNKNKHSAETVVDQ